MKELNKKVFLTLFGILTLILVISLIILNIQSYRREYENVERSLTIMDDPWMGRGPDFSPGPGPDMEENPDEGQDFEDKGFDDQDGPDIENMMIIDYEVYTVMLSDGTISQIISNGSTSSDFDANSVAEDILRNSSQDTMKIENLYLGNYSYNYKFDKIVIINDESVAAKLRKVLLESLLIFVVLEAVIAFIAKLVTGWIIKPAQEAFDRQKEFIADASHELKTPLAVIMASSDEIAVDENNSKYIDNIKYESDRMSKLISGLLDLSKLEEGVSKDSYKEENLSKIVEKTALVFEGVAFEQGVQIETEVEDDIPLKCSKEEIEKLVSTIIDNAIKHSEKDTSVVVKLYKGNKTVLKVINTGEPIKPGDEEKIFERFYRADKSRNRSDNRYGLGLAIAKRIVTNHGGTIKASSEDGKTTFKISF